MRKSSLIPVGAVLLIGSAAAALFYFPMSTATTNPGQGSVSTGGGLNPAAPKVGDFFPYDCATPALSSQLLCDKLPTGYVILPRFVNSPAPHRQAGMSDSAFALLQKTFGNGVCDPNETWGTDPLDCAAGGNQLQDPYTGRPGFTVNVCQALPVTEPKR